MMLLAYPVYQPAELEESDQPNDPHESDDLKQTKELRSVMNYSLMLLGI